MEFFESSRKVVTPIRKGISSFDLSLDKNFDLIDSIHYELISLVGLITENLYLDGLPLHCDKIVVKHDIHKKYLW